MFGASAKSTISMANPFASTLHWPHLPGTHSEPPKLNYVSIIRLNLRKDVTVDNLVGFIDQEDADLTGILPVLQAMSTADNISVPQADGKVICKCRKKCGGPDGEGRPVAYSTRSLHRRNDTDFATPGAAFTQFLASATPQIEAGPSSSMAALNPSGGLKHRVSGAGHNLEKRRRNHLPEPSSDNQDTVSLNTGLSTVGLHLLDIKQRIKVSDNLVHAQKELEVHRNGVDIRLPFFRDLLADTGSRRHCDPESRGLVE
ncbi:hypothetical protein B0H10DRAFT_2355230 [Mycena sp. CBHHK59/15]|nr:hypothetical protein B0H10DRAFT_2355230 [Mycena sp. CBHHK59/15]